MSVSCSVVRCCHNLVVGVLTAELHDSSPYCGFGGPWWYIRRRVGTTGSVDVARIRADRSDAAERVHNVGCYEADSDASPCGCAEKVLSSAVWN